MSDIQHDKVRILHCTKCVAEGIGVMPGRPQSLSVGVNPEGDLIIWCNIHKSSVHIFVAAATDFPECDCAFCKHDKFATRQ